MLRQLLLEAFEHLAVWAAWLPEPTFERDVRLGQPQLVEEAAGHVASS